MAYSKPSADGDRTHWLFASGTVQFRFDVRSFPKGSKLVCIVVRSPCGGTSGCLAQTIGLHRRASSIAVCGPKHPISWSVRVGELIAVSWSYHSLLPELTGDIHRPGLKPESGRVRPGALLAQAQVQAQLPGGLRGPVAWPFSRARVRSSPASSEGLRRTTQGTRPRSPAW